MPTNIVFDKPVNLKKLIAELVAAGFRQFSSRDGEFLVVEDGDDGKLILEIYAAHDPNPSPAELQTLLSDAVQRHLDQVAGERGYSSLFAAITYLESTVPQWAADATACRNWRDAVWVACYAIMAEVQVGARPIPTAEELILELPRIAW